MKLTNQDLDILRELLESKLEDIDNGPEGIEVYEKPEVYINIIKKLDTYILTKMLDIIIARYKEDISWINSLPQDRKIYVYNKFYQEGITLPNVGRESHTYLYHIIQNYYQLSQYTAFCQGNPKEHCANIIDILAGNFTTSAKKMHDGFYSLGQIVNEGPYANLDYRHPFGLPMFYILNLIFDIEITKDKSFYQTMYGGQFIVENTNILARPLAFYKCLYQILSFEINPIEGFLMERLWPFIFNKQIKLSNKFIYLINSLNTHQ